MATPPVLLLTLGRNEASVPPVIREEVRAGYPACRAQSPARTVFESAGTPRLHRAPGFAAGVILTLGIGIGAAAGIGTIVYGVLVRDLPYENPGQLVRVGFVTDGAASPGDLHSEATCIHFARRARSFTELGAYATNDAFNVTDGDAPERVSVAMVTPNLLTLLGARPLGETFQRGDTSWSGARTPIRLSEKFWRRRYGAVLHRFETPKLPLQHDARRLHSAPCILIIHGPPA